MKVKKYVLLLGVVVALIASPFVTKSQNIMLNPSDLATETVTNTGTAFLTSRGIKSGDFTTTVVQVEITKTSGTVAGTVSLFGSIDGTNFRSITSTTYTATDVASQGFIWTIPYCPVPFYRVTWTGAGTMIATFQAKVQPR